jgi:transcriptional regulator with XRE-family HTH domain
LRRELTIEMVAERAGVTRKTVAEAERGNPATSIGVYAGVLWALGLLGQLENVATAQNETDDRLAMDTEERKRAPRGGRRWEPLPEDDDGVPF